MDNSPQEAETVTSPLSKAPERKRMNPKRNYKKKANGSRPPVYNLSSNQGSFILDITVILRIAAPFTRLLEVISAASEYFERNEIIKSGYCLIASLYLAAAANVAKNSIDKDGICEVGDMLCAAVYVPVQLIPLLQGFGDVKTLDNKVMRMVSPEHFVKSCIYIAQQCVRKSVQNNAEGGHIRMDIPESGYFFRSYSSIEHVKKLIEHYINDLRLKVYHAPLSEGQRKLAPPEWNLAPGFSFPTLYDNSFPYIPKGFDFTGLDTVVISYMYQLYNSRGADMLSEDKRDQHLSVLRLLEIQYVDDPFENYSIIFNNLAVDIFDRFEFYNQKFRCEKLIYSKDGGDPFILYRKVKYPFYNAGSDDPKIVESFHDTSDWSRIYGYAYYPLLVISKPYPMVFGSDQSNDVMTLSPFVQKVKQLLFN